MDTPKVDVSAVGLMAMLEGTEPLTDEQFCDMVGQVRNSSRIRRQFATLLKNTFDDRAESIQNDPVAAMKLAQGLYAICDYEQAEKWLENAGASKQQCELKGRTLCAIGKYKEAMAAFEEAESKGADPFMTAMAVVDCLRRAGELEAANERLKRVARVGEIRAEYHFQMARLHEAAGLYEQALNEYEQAVSLDGQHREALFHLAYANDLYGDDDLAIAYYEQCVEEETVHVNALLNLTVLYEDAEDYDMAAKCVKKVLAAHPNHSRAKLFLKDIESSMTMYYDEEQEKRIDKRNQVLEIPITDFELSVRSRNCLKKMNIRYLGDLLRVTESELLAYKNFGETSLAEIKCILAQKNLRLGQMLEDRGGSLETSTEDTPEKPGPDEELLATSVADLELSVRARKCLHRLNINMIGDLVKCTEAELLGCKNFGMTSLLEIQQRLKERNLSLRKLDEEE